MRSSRPAPDEAIATGRPPPPPHLRHATTEPAPKPSYGFLVAVVAFIIYGSLFPFDFVSQGLPLERFFAEDHIFGNRADAIDNFLLFVPLGVALHLGFRRGRARLAAAVLSVLVLAIGVQLIQLYLPSRIASLADAFWNTIGMGAGMLAAERARQVFAARLAPQAHPRDIFLLILLGLWFVYESFPFVPTLDVGLLREHVKSAIVAPPFDSMRLLQHGVGAMLAGIAATRVGVLRRPLAAVAAIAMASILLEVFVAYGDLRRETLLGIGMGLAAGYVTARRLPSRIHVVVAALAFGALLITVLTPYRAALGRPEFSWEPFAHLLSDGWASQLPGAGFEALALAGLVWSATVHQLRTRAGAMGWRVLVLVLLAALEWVRVGWAGFPGDTTTLTLALMLMAAAAFRVEQVGAMPAAPMPQRTASVRAGGASGPAKLAPLTLLACSAGALTLGMWGFLALPGIPYNVKNLFGGEPLIGSAQFSLALLWLGAGPWLVARTAVVLDGRRRHGALWVPLMVIGIALASFAVVNHATPDSMLEKIIGAPDSYRRIVSDNYWGDAWRARLSAWPIGFISSGERVIRYVALYSLFSIPLVVALLAVPRHERRARVIVNVVCLLPLWVLAKHVVVDWAITDNLVELMAEGGVVYLAALIALFTANAVTLVACRPATMAAAKLAVLTIAQGCAAWWLFKQGVEPVVMNSGNVFNGVQFLLGENRTALLSEAALFARWCALYAGALAVTVAGVLLAIRMLPAAAVPTPRPPPLR